MGGYNRSVEPFLRVKSVVLGVALKTLANIPPGLFKNYFFSAARTSRSIRWDPRRDLQHSSNAIKGDNYFDG